MIVKGKSNTNCKAKSVEDTKSLQSVDRGMTVLLLKTDPEKNKNKKKIKTDPGVQSTWIQV